MITGVKEQSLQVKAELGDPLATYTKHYSQRNESMMKDANKIWTQLHQERTNMLLAKENYYGEMCTLRALRRQFEEQPKGWKESPQVKIEKQQMKAE